MKRPPHGRSYLWLLRLRVSEAGQGPGRDQVVVAGTAQQGGRRLDVRCKVPVLVIEADLKPHDFLPLQLIVEQAGGTITDWNGQPLHMGSSGEVIAAATPVLHQSAISTLSLGNNSTITNGKLE